MPKRIAPTKKGVRGWLLHFLIFIIGNAIMWYMCYAGTEGWVYPWPIWISAAWFLTMIGHASLVWANHSDKNYDEWVKQTHNG